MGGGSANFGFKNPIIQGGPSRLSFNFGARAPPAYIGRRQDGWKSRDHGEGSRPESGWSKFEVGHVRFPWAGTIDASGMLLGGSAALHAESGQFSSSPVLWPQFKASFESVQSPFYDLASHLDFRWPKRGNP